MKNPASVIPLIEKWELFAKKNPQKDMYVFAQWLLASRQEQGKENSSGISKSSSENSARAAILITKLQHYLGMYVKPSVKELGFSKEHEYNFLFQISKMDKPNKNDLSKENMVEFSTGRDVIRRLKAKGLVSEKTDPEDKRAAQLSITAKGEKVLEKSFDLMAGSLTDFMGNLNEKEQTQLVSLLARLNSYHASKNKKDILPYL
jgi:DNA-binding MarR family transcriptional regulator